jgi:hypothetical protein
MSEENLQNENANKDDQQKETGRAQAYDYAQAGHFEGEGRAQEKRAGT